MASEHIVAICTICPEGEVNLRVKRSEALYAVVDHVLDEHRDALLTQPADRRAKWLRRLVRITDRLGKPERLTLYPS